MDGLKRNGNGTFADGTAPGPGRPRGKTMKEFARDFFMQKTDEEKKAYIEILEEKKPGFAWTMGEGNPENKTDLTSGGEKIAVNLVSFDDNHNDSSQPSTE